MENFLSKVPPDLLAGKTPSEKWLYEQQSIQAQQNEHLAKQGETILTRLAENEEREKIRTRQAATDRAELKEEIASVSKRVSKFEVLWQRVTGIKWIVSVLVTALAIPIALTILSAAAIRAFEKWWK